MADRMKILRLAVCGLLAAPLVFAEPPNFKPGNHGNGSQRSTTGHSDGSTREGGERAGRGERSREDVEQLRKRMQEFCEKHSPRRWAALQENSGNDRNPWKFGGMFLLGMTNMLFSLGPMVTRVRCLMTRSSMTLPPWTRPIRSTLGPVAWGMARMTAVI